jgi:maleate isomerase
MTRLGMLVPSSNTVLEPLCQAILAGVDSVSVHFSRLQVTENGLGARAHAQFDLKPMLAAARLLADARVDAICWNGTSAGWLGFGADETLCRAIEGETGIPTTSSVLTLNDVLAKRDVRTLGLATPYTDDVQTAIVETYVAAGVDIVAEAHLGLAENDEFARVSPADVERMVRSVAAANPDAVVVFCTNLRGADVAPALEESLGVSVLDSAALGLRGALERAGVDPALVQDWGSAFAYSRAGKVSGGIG